MTNTMAAHEPIHYLDSILNEEEKRCEYGHQWRNFTISRSGRFKSKNKKRDIVDGNLFDTTLNSTMSSSSSSSSSSPATSLSPTVSTKAKIKDDRTSSTPNNNGFKEPEKYKSSRQPFSSAAMPGAGGVSYQSQQNSKGLRDSESYKSYYETNL